MNGVYTVLAVMFLVLATQGAIATQHVVGGSQGWDESVDYGSWASGHTFKVGDQLGKFLPSTCIRTVPIITFLRSYKTKTNLVDSHCNRFIEHELCWESV